MTLPLSLGAIHPSVLTPEELGLVRSASELLQRAEEQLQKAQKSIIQAEFDSARKGYNVGVANAHAEMTEALIRLESEAVKRLAVMEKSIVQLAIEIVRRISARLGAESFMPALVETAMAEVKTSSHVILRVSPLVAPHVAKHLNDLGATLSGPGSFDVQADPNLDEFACVLETELGFVAADLEIQLQSIEKALHSPRMDHS